MKQSVPLSLPAFTPELQLILDLLAEEHRADAQVATLQDHLREDIDWQLFLEYVRHHRLQPWLYSKLRSLQASRVPAHVLHALKQDYVKNTIRMLQLAGEMSRVCEELAARSIRVLVLKGPILGTLLYGDMSLRTSKDLDILVPQQDLERAERALHELGFSLYYEIPRIFNDWRWKAHHVTYVNRETGMQVELHWKMNQDCGKEPDFEELWSRRRIFADRIAYLSEQDMFLQLIQHGARHGWFRLRWLLDIERMLHSLARQDELLLFVAQHQSRHLVGQAMLLITYLLKSPIPEAFHPLLADRHALRIAARSLAFISHIVNPGNDASPAVRKQFNAYLLSIMSFRTLLRYVAVRIYPNSWDSTIFKLPRRLIFLYVPLRPFLWIWRRVSRSHLAAKEESRLDAGTY